MAVQAARSLFDGLGALGLEYAAFLQEAGGILSLGSSDIQLHGEVQVPCQHRQQSQRVLAFLLQYPDDFASVGGPAREEFCHQLNTALELCSTTDRAAKGFDTLSPWHYLQDLITLLARPA